MLKLVLGSVFCFLFAGCAGFSVTGGPGEVAPAPFESRSLAPTDLARVGSVLVSPLDFDNSARESLSMGEAFHGSLTQSLTSRAGLRIVSPREAGLSESFSTTSLAPLQKRASLARSRGIDAVLVTNILQYVERQGSAAGTEIPAKVSFTMNLYRSADLRELWKASYYFEDQALSENLFRLNQRVGPGSGSGWKSAHDALREGFAAASSDLLRGR